MDKENLAKAEEIYDIITKLEDWAGGRQKEANIACIAQALQETKVRGVTKFAAKVALSVRLSTLPDYPDTPDNSIPLAVQKVMRNHTFSSLYPIYKEYGIEKLVDLTDDSTKNQPN